MSSKVGLSTAEWSKTTQGNQFKSRSNPNSQHKPISWINRLYGILHRCPRMALSKRTGLDLVSCGKRLDFRSLRTSKGIDSFSREEPAIFY